MRKIIPCLVLSGAALAAFAGLQFAASAEAGSARVTTETARSGQPVVIELFTSQGCSSCPPADMLARRLAKDPSLLVITRPVTYWDRLGWKDTLAREENTQLQRAYAAKGGEGAGVYTPQIVVNGDGAAVGSREGDIRSLVRRADRSGPRITAATHAKGGMTVTVSGKSDYLADASFHQCCASRTCYGQLARRASEIYGFGVLFEDKRGGQICDCRAAARRRADRRGEAHQYLKCFKIKVAFRRIGAKHSSGSRENVA